MKVNMTLGEVIESLRKAEKLIGADAPCYGFGSLISYRGYYEDLAIEPTSTLRPVSDVIAEYSNAIGTAFTGYKGGSYVASEDTPVWYSDYGAVTDDAVIYLYADLQDECIRLQTEEGYW